MNRRLVAVALVALALVLGLVAVRLRGPSSSATVPAPGPPSVPGGPRAGGRASDDVSPDREPRDDLAPSDAVSRGPRSERIELVPAGPEPTTLAPERAAEVVATLRPGIRTCIESQGGRDAFVAAWGEIGAETRNRRLRFDLGPDGRALPGSVTIVPPLDPRFASCFIRPVSGLEFGPIGGPGVRVAVPLGSLLGRARAGASGDGDGGVGP